VPDDSQSHDWQPCAAKPVVQSQNSRSGLTLKNALAPYSPFLPFVVSSVPSQPDVGLNEIVGRGEGAGEGWLEGAGEGRLDGTGDGFEVGVGVGKAVAVGAGVGCGVGTGDVVGIEVGDVGGGVGLEVGCTVGCEEGARKQICHPASLTEVSEYHDMLVLGDTETPSGPVVPWYSTPSIISLS